MDAKPELTLIAGARRSHGFTLVELLLVLAILALLAGIVLPRLINRGLDARITVTKSQIATIGQALRLFEVDNGRFPAGRNGLIELAQRPRDANNWKGPYLETIPKDPWEHDYVFECPGKRHPSSFDITSAGPDGVIGNADDIAN